MQKCTAVLDPFIASSDRLQLSYNRPSFIIIWPITISVGLDDPAFESRWGQETFPQKLPDRL